MVAIDSRARVALTSFLLFCVALFLAAYSAKNRWVASIGTTAVGELLRPLQVLVRSAGTSSSGLLERYVFLVGVSEENERLRHRVRALDAENSRLRESENEITRLRNLLQASEASQLKGQAADVIGVDPSNWVDAITINRGKADGIRPGMAVVDGRAVVGQVIAASPSTARVLLITDHTSSVDALIQSSRARGLLEGSGAEHCRLRYLSAQEHAALGDLVITSGLDGVFPKGLLLGVVAEFKEQGEGMFHSVRVQPSAELEKLETVLVVTEQTSPQEPQ